jgi:hypothetical protein
MPALIIDEPARALFRTYLICQRNICAASSSRLCLVEERRAFAWRKIVALLWKSGASAPR